MFERGRWKRERFRDRVFGRGDLKYVILELLKDRPRHGYDIIRAIDDRFAGLYAPSPGAVYPTLQMLEDMGLVTSLEQDGRKVYSITDEGRRFLEEREDVVDEIRDRVRGWWGTEGGPELHETMHELGALMHLLGRRGGRAWGDPEKLRRIREVIARTKSELETILSS